MFVAAVIRLRLKKASVLPPYTGRSTHGCFFNLLDQADAAMAKELHEQDANWSKGFTVSSLMGLPMPMGRQIVAPEGQRCAMRITSVSAELSQVLMEKVLPNLPESLTIGEHELVVEGCDTSTEAHPLAGVVSPTEMAAKHMLEGQTPPDRITMHFASPTTFRSSGRELPLPMPQMVFGGYLDRWNANVSTQLDRELRKFVEECVVIHRYDLQTTPVRLEFGAPLTGFVGRCQFRVADPNSYWLRVLDLLASFAFWCGTGYKITMGMGQTYKVLPSRRPVQGNSVADATQDEG